MTEYEPGDVVTGYGGVGEMRTIKMTLFHTDRRYETVTACDLAEARRIAWHHVGSIPTLEGGGLFAYAFDRGTGRSLRVTSGAKLADLFQ